MHAFLLPFFRAVLVASWQGSLALVLVLIVRQAMGARIPARWRYLLWMLVLLRLLVPAFVLPRHAASLENIRAVAPPFERFIEAAPTSSRRVSEPAVVRLPATRREPLPHLTPVPRPRPLWEWAAIGWFAGAIALGAWFAGCAVQMHRRLRGEVFEAAEETQAVWRACCERLHLSRPPRLLAADWMPSPALVGLLRPALLIPRAAEAAFSARDWEHVFAHEIAHLRCRDHWGQLLQLIALCAHWFNPLVWLGFRRLRTDRELAADEWALRHLESGRALEYGETLLKALAGITTRGAFQPGVVGITEDSSQMKLRLGRIAAFLPRRRLLGSLVGLSVVLLLGTMVLGQGTTGPAAAPSPAATATSGTTPAERSVDALATDARGLSDRLLAAARAGDAVKVGALIDGTHVPHAVTFSAEAATQMLDALVGRRELPAFTVLLDQLKQTNYAKDWQPNDELLVALVKDRRTDFLDALLARRLVLDCLRPLTHFADPATAAWITRRVGEVTQQRADVAALEAAAKAGDLPAMQRLIDAGVDVNAYGADDDTPLVKAAKNDRLAAAQWLLNHGAQVDRPRFPGWNYTPLCLCQSVPMAALLKKYGADIHARLWRRDVNILVYVAMFGKTEVVEWFLQQGLDPKMLGDNGENLLFDVASVQTAELLLARGVDPDRANTFGNTPICSARNSEIAQVLVDHGAKVTGFKEPLLPRMIQFGSGGAVDVALKAGAEHDPEMLQAALITAAHLNRSDIAQVLIKYGANPNEPGVFSSKTDTMLPLVACCIWGGVKTAKVLLDAGADPNNPKAPRPMLQHAMHNGYKELAELLRARGAKGASDLSFAIATQAGDKVKALLLSAPAYADNPAFWDDVIGSAARLGDVDTLRAALAKGVPVVVGPLAKATDPYSAATVEGQHEALAVLLAARQPEADPAELRWALWEAVWGSHPYPNQRSADHFEKCVQMLLAAGVPVNGQDGDKHERNLLSAAIFTRNPGGNPAVMEMLVRAGADPNPVVGTETDPQAHLLDAVRESCAKGYCSAPLADTLIKLNQLAPAQPDARAHPATPTPDSATPPEKPATIGHYLSITGTVSMADGTPLDKEEIMARIHSTRGQGGSMVDSERVESGSFPLRLDEMTTGATVAVEQKGCAPVFAGPFDAGTLDRLDDLHLRLTHGYSAAVQIVDAAGHPLAGARLRPYYAGPPTIDLADAVTDASGQATIEHLGEAPLNIRVAADGFEADEATGLHLDAAKPYRWTLQSTQPLHGTVGSAATGEPINGAVIKLGGVRGPHNEDHYDPRKAPMLTTSDAQGNFVLQSLRPDSRYYLFVEAPNYGGAYFRGVTLTQGKLDVTLGPELLIRGKIIHVPPSVIHLGKVYLHYGQTFHIGQNTMGSTSEVLNLVPVAGEADFTVGSFYKVSGEPLDPKNMQPWDQDNIDLYVDLQARTHFRVDELPISNFIFDLAKKPPSIGPNEPAQDAPDKSKPSDIPAAASPPSGRSDERTLPVAHDENKPSAALSLPDGQSVGVGDNL